MTANAKFGWRVGVATLVIAAMILVAAVVLGEKRDSPQVRLDGARLSEASRSDGGDRVDVLHAAAITSLRGRRTGEAVRLLVVAHH